MKTVKTLVIAAFLFPVQLLAYTISLENNSKDTLPFAISAAKKMPEIELEDKKEGTFITGLPRVEFDPIRGFGAGGNINLFVNKTKKDPFFEYTPYRHRVNAEFFIFQNGRVRTAFNYDGPYLFDSKWRLRADMVFWEDPNAQYWGIGRNFTLQALEVDGEVYNNIHSYEQRLNQATLGTDGIYYSRTNFNTVLQRTRLFNLLGERTFMEGRLRVMFGYEALFNGFESYNGRVASERSMVNGKEVETINEVTLIDIQAADGTWDRFNLAGLNNDSRYLFTSMLAGALIYDTRDFEPDPSNGVFLQYSHEYSAPWLGSQFNFNKFMVQGQYLNTVARWKNGRNRITLAGLAAFGYIFGPDISFIEMFDLSSQAEAGGITVLGGGRSLRGYREARYLAPAVTLINLEVRSRLYDFKFAGQHLALGLTPFFDMGSIWDKPADISSSGWLYAPGIGGRLAWNQSTIIRLDFARGSEGSQTFFGFGHIF